MGEKQFKQFSKSIGAVHNKKIECYVIRHPKDTWDFTSLISERHMKQIATEVQRREIEAKIEILKTINKDISSLNFNNASKNKWYEIYSQRLDKLQQQLKGL